MEKLLNIVLDSTSHGIIVADSDFSVIYSNSAASKIIDKSVYSVDFIKELLTDSYNELKSDDNKMSLRIFLNDNDSIRTIQIKATDISQNGSKFILFELNELDNLSEIENEISGNTKIDFISNISHEFRTPLNAILGYSDILINESVDENHISRLNIIKQNSNNLLSLINDLLSLSKLQSGLVDVVADATDLKQVFDEIYDIFSFQIKNKGLNFDIQFKQFINVRLSLDEIMLRQILFNLIGNAIKFTHEGSVIVKVEFQNLRNNKLDLQLQVIDTGLGISDEYKEHLYEIFSQANENNSKSFGGAGLGLAIVSKLVKKLKGELNIDSKLGVGSVFTLKLANVPFIKENKVSEMKYTNSEVFILKNIKSILVVNDQKLDRKNLKQMFRSYNASYYEADRAESAIILAAEIKPDLIFMNLRMSGMNGIEATRHIKLNKNTRNIPIIAMSNVHSVLKLDEEMHLFYAIINKPIKSDELNSVLRQIDKNLKENN
ncbi:MAG: response regulator [Desulfobulbaceae bacterium]|nr:response regulator [Desulfobulbaceae bacterium]